MHYYKQSLVVKPMSLYRNMIPMILKYDKTRGYLGFRSFRGRLLEAPQHTARPFRSRLNLPSPHGGKIMPGEVVNI